MMTESQKDLTQNKSSCHRVSDTLDTAAMQNPKGNLNVFLLSFHHLFLFDYSPRDGQDWHLLSFSVDILSKLTKPLLRLKWWVTLSSIKLSMFHELIALLMLLHFRDFISLTRDLDLVLSLRILKLSEIMAIF